MIAYLIMQVASPAAASAETRKIYDPYRACLLSQVGKVEVATKTDDAIVAEARSACMAANLHAGSNALFVEIKATGSKAAAIDNLAALRAELEAEALAAMRSNR